MILLTDGLLRRQISSMVGILMCVGHKDNPWAINFFLGGAAPISRSGRCVFLGNLSLARPFARDTAAWR
jgi:hypothetical protein